MMHGLGGAKLRMVVRTAAPCLRLDIRHQGAHRSAKHSIELLSNGRAPIQAGCAMHTLLRLTGSRDLCAGVQLPRAASTAFA